MTRASVQTPGVSRAARVRARTAAALMSALLLGVGYKAYGLQVEQGDKFREQALRQHVRNVEIPAPRGIILDTRGRPLAISADAESVWADPRAVVDVAGSAERVAAALALDVNVVEARLASRKRFAWIARHVTPEQAAAVKALKLAGIEVAHEPRRWYPERSSGGPVIGFAGLDGNGLDGLELQLEERLKGEKARFAALRDARGKTMMSEGVSEPTPGATVELTLDRSIQHIADEALAASVSANKAKSGVAVVLDVRTGAVLALASVPTYDPNDPAEAVRAKARNRAVTDVYEIGSVMKVFTVAAALDAGLTRADELWDVEGGAWMAPGGKRVTDVHHDQVLTTGGIIKRSSNVGATKIGLRLGRLRLYEALTRFGFGAKSGIDLPGEQRGRVRDGSTWRDVELVTMSWGYGLTVSPIQIAAAMAAIGNGGVYNPPRIVARVTGADGHLVYERPIERRPIMKPSTAAAMLPILASVFEPSHPGKRDGGTGANIKVPGFRAGGKTGTAHKYDPTTHRYAPHSYLSSFAGLVPIADPRIAVVVVVDDPSGGDYFGGTVAGPVFGQIASASLRYLGVPGDAPIEPPAATKGGKPAPPAAPELGDGDDEEAEAGLLDLAPFDESMLDVHAPAVTVPDFRGVGVARALALAGERGLAVELHGSGRCVTQSLPVGPAPAGATIALEFAARD
ncbi:MAG: transpeptidase family protein [Myxococcales bacterium]|nr:transpeptidase family protein [Myxococcales bacterium]